MPLQSRDDSACAGFQGPLFAASRRPTGGIRPESPAALFDWLAAVAPGRGLALDVATGNGQAAVALAAHFETVIATEPSAAQLAQARRAPARRLPPRACRVDFRRGRQRRPRGRGPGGALVRLAAFHRPKRVRVLRPGGVLAFWTYGNCHVHARDRPARRRFLARRRRAVLAARAPPRRRRLPRPRRAVAGARSRRLSRCGRDWDVARCWVTSTPGRPCAAAGRGPGATRSRCSSHRSRTPGATAARDMRWPLVVRAHRAEPRLVAAPEPVRPSPALYSAPSQTGDPACPCACCTPAVLCLASPAAALADDAASPPLAAGIDDTAMDKAVRPQDDLFRYVNGTWLANTPFPAEYASAGIGIMLFEKAQADVQAILLEAAAAGDKATPEMQRLGAMYASFMDEAKVEVARHRAAEAAVRGDRGDRRAGGARALLRPRAEPRHQHAARRVRLSRRAQLRRTTSRTWTRTASACRTATTTSRPRTPTSNSAASTSTTLRSS